MFNLSLAEPQFGRAKKIKIWSNGDRYGVCHEFTINPNRFRTWNSILTYIGRVIQPENGAVRKLISLTTKKSVYCFKNLDPEDRYVAVGQRGLVMIENGYKTASERDLLRNKKQAKRHYSGDFLPPKFRFLQITKKRGLTIIYVVVNKLTCQTPVKIVLNEKDFEHWDVVLEFLANQLDIPNGIQGLYTIFGTLVENPQSLQHGYVYVALPCGEKYALIDYMKLFDDLLKPMSSFTVSIRPSSKLSLTKSTSRKSKESVSKVSSKYKYDTYSSKTQSGSNMLPHNERDNRFHPRTDLGSSLLFPSEIPGRKSRTSAKSKPSSLPAIPTDNSYVSSAKPSQAGSHQNPSEIVNTTRRLTAKSKSSKMTISSMPRIVEESASVISLNSKDNLGTIPGSQSHIRPNSRSTVRSNVTEEIGHYVPIGDNMEKRDSTQNTQLSLCGSPSIEVSVKSSITVESCQAQNICDKNQEWKCKLTPCSLKQCTCQTDGVCDSEIKIIGSETAVNGSETKANGSETNAIGSGSPSVTGSETKAIGSGTKIVGSATKTFGSETKTIGSRSRFGSAALSKRSERITEHPTDMKRVSYGGTQYKTLDPSIEGEGSTLVRAVQLDEAATPKPSGITTADSKKTAATNRTMQTERSYLRGLKVNDSIRLKKAKGKDRMAASSGTIYLDDDSEVSLKKDSSSNGEVEQEQNEAFPAGCSVFTVKPGDENNSSSNLQNGKKPFPYACSIFDVNSNDENASSSDLQNGKQPFPYACSVFDANLNGENTSSSNVQNGKQPFPYACSVFDANLNGENTSSSNLPNGKQQFPYACSVFDANLNDEQKNSSSSHLQTGSNEIDEFEEGRGAKDTMSLDSIENS